MSPKAQLILSFTASATLIGAAVAAPVTEGGRKFTVE